MGLFEGLFTLLAAKPPNPVNQSLADIARGMQYAVNTAQEASEMHIIGVFKKCFNDDGTAKVVTVKLPSGQTMDVPLINLISPNVLELDEVTVEMSVRIDQTEVKTHGTAGVLGHEVQRTSFTCSLAPQSSQREGRDMSVVDMVMKFKAGDPTEGVARVTDAFLQSLKPKDPPKDDKPKEDPPKDTTP